MNLVAFVFSPLASLRKLWRPHLNDIVTMYKYSGYYIIDSGDWEEIIKGLPEGTDIIYISVGQLPPKHLLALFPGGNYGIDGDRMMYIRDCIPEIREILALDPPSEELVRIAKTIPQLPSRKGSLAPSPGKVVMIVTNEDKLDIDVEGIARRLGYDGYYHLTVSDTFYHNYDVWAYIGMTDRNIDLVFVVADIDQPSKIEELKYPHFRGRRVLSIIPTGKLPLGDASESIDISPTSKYKYVEDIHLHILSFLPGEEVSRSARVSRSWRDALESKGGWALWWRMSIRDGGSDIKLEDFKRLGGTPTEAYNGNLAKGYIEELEREVTETLDKDAYMIMSVNDEYNFRLTLPIFGRIYDIIRRFPERADISSMGFNGLLTNLGRTGSSQDIVDYHRAITAGFSTGEEKSFPPERLLVWMEGNPRVQPLTPFIIDYGPGLIDRSLNTLWRELYYREDIIAALRAWFKTREGESSRLECDFEKEMRARRTLDLIGR